MSVRSSAKFHLGIAVIRLAAVPPLLPLHSPGSDRSCRTLRSQIPSQLPFSPSPSSVLFLRPFAPRALPRFSATMASADSSPALTGEASPGKVQESLPSCRPALPDASRMTFGLRCCQPACRPHQASLPVRVPTVESLLSASFSFTSRLRLAVSLRLPSSAPVGSFHPTRFCPCWAHWRRHSCLPCPDSSRHLHPVQVRPRQECRHAPHRVPAHPTHHPPNLT